MTGEWENRSSIFFTDARKSSRVGYDNKGIFLAGTKYAYCCHFKICKMSTAVFNVQCVWYAPKHSFYYGLRFGFPNYGPTNPYQKGIPYPPLRDMPGMCLEPWEVSPVPTIKLYE